MDINKQIIDQRIRKIVSDNPIWFENTKDGREKVSKAFLILAISASLEVELSEAYECVTDGGGDAGIDGIYIGDVNDSEFTVILYQGKYNFNLEKSYTFPDNAVLRAVNSVGVLFDPKKRVDLNNLIRPKIEEIRSLIMDGYIPIVKCVLVNNGGQWQKEGEKHIENAGFPESQVSFSHFNHQDIAKYARAKQPINESITLSGKAIIENFDFKRVLIGKIAVSEIGKIMQMHGDSLLEKNIRKFLGVNKNRVNTSITETLEDVHKRKNFYFFNNGITMLCSKFSYNALQNENWQLKIDDLQIINGGQTSKTILHVIEENPTVDFSTTSVLLRLYEVSEEDDATHQLTTDITIATNSQTPVDLRDLRANDTKQRDLGVAISQLGYEYLTKKGSINSVNSSKTIPSSVAAESSFTIWKRKPQLAKYKKRELFGKFYDDVFESTTGAQVVVGVLIFRYCDLKRKNSDLVDSHKHLPYSKYFLSMICGEILLNEKEISLNKLDHISFESVLSHWEQNREGIYSKAIELLEVALKALFPEGIEDLDPRRLAATFRRGDLLTKLN